MFDSRINKRKQAWRGSIDGDWIKTAPMIPLGFLVILAELRGFVSPHREGASSESPPSKPVAEDRAEPDVGMFLKSGIDERQVFRRHEIDRLGIFAQHFAAG